MHTLIISSFWGKDWSEGPYLFLLRRKLRAKVHDHRATELQRRSNIFPSPPPFQRGHAWGDFLALSDDLTSELSY